MTGTGPTRREGFLDATAVARLLRDPTGFEPAAVQALAGEVYGLSGRPSLHTLSIGPGRTPSDLLPGGAVAGFVLDLGPAGWRSEWGGLLLFQDTTGTVHGYRPVPGALTLYPASARPFLSLIAPGGARRTSIFGWWV